MLKNMFLEGCLFAVFGINSIEIINFDKPKSRLWNGHHLFGIYIRILDITNKIYNDEIYKTTFNSPYFIKCLL